MKFEKRHGVLIVVIALVVLGIFYFESEKSGNSQIESGESVKISDKPLEKVIDGETYELAPELVGISGYLNTDGNEIKISDFEGKVILIDFWTYTCINCIRTLPYLTSWDEKYRDKGLVIIGVHAPEFEFEELRENVEAANLKYGIEYPVVQDNDMTTWRNFENRFWPHKYLIDAEGYIRYDHIGEGGYEETELKIQELLEEAGKNANLDLTEETGDGIIRRRITPELYAGVLFAFPREQYIGNKKLGDRLEDYVLPARLTQKNVIYLDGIWYYNEDNLQLKSDEGIIALDFTAEEVNIVGDNTGEIVEMEIFVDGQYVKSKDAGADVEFEGDRAYVVVDSAQLYNVYDGEYGNFRLDLKLNKKDFIFNAFTFG